MDRSRACGVCEARSAGRERIHDTKPAACRLDIQSESASSRAEIEQLAGRMIEALRVIIRHCRSPHAGRFTASDFPLARIEQAALDELVVTGRHIEDIYPLSPMQHGMLFHTLFDSKSGVYCEQLSCTMEGRLNVPAFQQAWQQVVNRHPVIRTSFHSNGLKHPVQIVHRQVRLPFVEQDWRTLSADEQDKQLNLLLDADRNLGLQNGTATVDAGDGNPFQ